ncbi:hypothetical protein [Streptomyces sp. BF23-19]|uniref:hypothetical protein n=1 Tax=Streptomyces TaxID=1883 RepID=UPI0034E43E68|nr:hypothetical protein OG253_02855 [Streptomyces virginiae]
MWKPREEIASLGSNRSYRRVRSYLHDKRPTPRPVTARATLTRNRHGSVLRQPQTPTDSERLQFKAARTTTPSPQHAKP